MNEDLFNELVESVKEGGEILQGKRQPSRRFVLSPLDIRAIRESYRLTQDQFAQLLGISVKTLHNWEQGRRSPEGPARVLLQVAARHPEALLDIVRKAD
jgi:putative transcriptional regulator